MKFKNRYLKELFSEDMSDENPLEFIEDGGWRGNGGKYENRELIFKFEEKFYSVCDSRSGSYFTSYYHESDDWRNDGEQDCNEVEKTVVTTYKWTAVKPKE